MSEARPKSVFKLWFAKQGDDYLEQALEIGIYYTAADCEAAIARLRDKPGFRDCPTGFRYCEMTIGRDHWDEGFIDGKDALDALDRSFKSD